MFMFDFPRHVADVSMSLVLDFMLMVMLASPAEECFENSLGQSETAYAWKSLGQLDGGTVSGDFKTARECFRRSLELDEKQGDVWRKFGWEGGGLVNGKNKKPKQCHRHALEHLVQMDNEMQASAWNEFGRLGGGQVHKEIYGEKACYRLAVELDPRHSAAWWNLALEGGDGLYDATICYRKSLEAQESSEGWVEFARHGGRTVHGVKYTEKRCYVRALELDKENADAWVALGTQCSEGKAKVNGELFDDKMCYRKALELNPDPSVKASAWYRLGLAGGEGMDDEKSCYRKSLESSKETEPDAWYQFARLCGKSGRINGVEYRKKRCLVEAIQLDPKHEKAWRDLAEEGGGKVNEVFQDPAACKLKADRIKEGAEPFSESEEESEEESFE